MIPLIRQIAVRLMKEWQTAIAELIARGFECIDA
jgi:hypothetical protein